MIAWGDWLLTPARAAIHRPTATAVVSDLHLGYAEARRRAGDSVPAPGVEEVLLPLQSLLRDCEVHSLVIAGDLFEAGPDNWVVETLLSWLASSGVQKLSVVPGNHDRGLRNVPEVLRPVERDVLLGNWRIVHGDAELPPGPVVQGHVHPALWLARGLRPAPCYLASERHLVLPAYSQDAAGGDIRRDTRWQDYRCMAIVANTIVEINPAGK